MGIAVREEILEGNLPEHPDRIEFGLYCETFLDGWISTLEFEPEPNEDPEEDSEEEPNYESDSEPENELEYVLGLGPKPELE